MDRSRNWKELLEIYKLQDKIESLERKTVSLKIKMLISNPARHTAHG